MITTESERISSSVKAVLGSTTDDETGSTVYSKLYTIEKHMHSIQSVYPTLAAGVTVTGGAAAWALGNYAEVVPVNTITAPFDIHFINVASTNVADTYELVIYAATTEVGRLRVTRGTGVNSVAPIFFMSPIIAANSQIQAKCASSSGGNDTLVMSIFYHTY